jgi:hypothetical protein
VGPIVHVPAGLANLAFERVLLEGSQIKLALFFLYAVLTVIA